MSDKKSRVPFVRSTRRASSSQKVPEPFLSHDPKRLKTGGNGTRPRCPSYLLARNLQAAEVVHREGAEDGVRRVAHCGIQFACLSRVLCRQCRFLVFTVALCHQEMMLGRRGDLQ